MRKFLIFRTDRVGDFLFSLILIKIIKKDFPNSHITLVASEKNYKYAKTFEILDDVVILKNNFFSKLDLIFKLKIKKFDTIIVHDGKNRSKFISFFLKSKKKIICVTDLINTQIDIIKKVCDQINLIYEESCLNFLENRKYSLSVLPFKNYLHLHFDEKWIHENYIEKYVNIQPTRDELIDFINNIIINNNLVITTGKNNLNLLSEIKFKLNQDKVKIFENQELVDIENIVFNAKLLISCHGWITHIASAKNIRQIDIIDTSYPYEKWTSHLRNYNYLNRKPFKVLSKEIINLI